MQRPIPCDVAVHNVGTNIRKPTIEYSDDEYQQVMSANLESTYKLSQVPLNL
jgi:Tropinone reductase 1